MSARTQCKRGHELNAKTVTVVTNEFGKKVKECKKCRTIRRRMYRNGLSVKRNGMGQGFCHDCQIERGGVVPKSGHRGITVTDGICEGCDRARTIVPSCDYDWPKWGKKAVSD